ncbi:uncharacterized protein [Parasteatoda tepidariorum]|uniref:uncharacterized protein n=1 Tax=Parasteatoda tepidariorum TaxID=114398 RepID=UPI00077FD1D5|nr:uncharacterized protein LOC107440076 [Parasteatoda tepidariorum]
MEDNKPKCILFKIVTSVLGILSGASILITFLAYKNYHAAVWGLLSAIFAAMNARLHISYRRNTLHRNQTPESLKNVTIFGGITTIVAIVAAITYFSLVAVFKEGYKLDGYMPAGIFATLTLKFTIGLIFAGKTYGNYLKNYNAL